MISLFQSDLALLLKELLFFQKFKRIFGVFSTFSCCCSIFNEHLACRSPRQLRYYSTSALPCQEVFSNFFDFFLLPHQLDSLAFALRDSFVSIAQRVLFVNRFFQKICYFLAICVLSQTSVFVPVSKSLPLREQARPPRHK